MIELECLRLDGSKKPVRLEGFKCFCDGYTGRDREAVDRHIKELADDLGVPPPERVPTCYPMAARLVLVDPRSIEVYGDRTSGEAEPVLFVTGCRARYLGVGSDQTDRELERHSIPLAKNLCPKVLSRQVWDLEEVRAGWDDLLLQSWSDGALYQEARLRTMLAPDELLAAVPNGRLGVEAIVMGGTIPTIGGFRYGRQFECALTDEKAGRELRVTYQIEPLHP